MKRQGGPGALWLKLLRDLRAQWKSFMAVFIICTLAVVLYMGLDATWRGLDRDLDRQFEGSNLADIWVRGQISERDLREIKALKGVEDAQRRISVQLEAEGLSEEAKVNLIASEGEGVISIPLVSSGRLPQLRDECLLSQRFAAAHGLGLGDSLQLKQGDRVFNLEITGLGLMPEFVVASEGDELSPSPGRIGFAYVKRETLDYLPFSEAAIKLLPDADEEAVLSALKAMFDEGEVVVSREDVFGIKMAMEESQQIRAMGAIFPLVFFLIAAMITWTTMNRLVESQRLQIGSLFAIGYTRGELMGHYALYGVLIAAAASIAGLLIAQFPLAGLLLSLLKRSYFVPDARPLLSPLTSLIVCAVLLLITGGASWLSARVQLVEEPAALLRPKPPSRGKRVFLERWTWLWGRLPFSEKMILRNLFRNNVRLLMGLAGAAGCTALMLAGFGLRNSVDYVLVSHYDRTTHYDLRVTLSDQATPDYARTLALKTGAEVYEEELLTAAEVKLQGGFRLKQLYVLADDHSLIALRDEADQPLTLPQRGAAVSRQMAEDEGLAPGDTLTLRYPGMRERQVQIARIIDIQLGQGIYMSRAAYDELGLAPYQPSHVLLRGEGLSAQSALGLDGVKEARTLSQERESGTATLEILDVIVLLMVLFSAALELMVFYNLGQLNFAERIRELATLKVLGFTPREMRRLVLLENIIMTLMGLPIGLALGPPLLQLVLSYGLPKTIQFVSYINPLSWLMTPAITVLFALLVNGLLGAKFKSINMVEALKSVE